MRVQVVVAFAALLSACGPETQPSQKANDGSSGAAQDQKRQAAIPSQSEDDPATRPPSQAEVAAPVELPPAVEPTVTAVDWDEMVRCGHVYASLDRSYFSYFGGGRPAHAPRSYYSTPEFKRMSAVMKGSGAARSRLSAAANRLRPNEWGRTQKEEVAPPFFADLHATTAACDRKFGFQVATILPPLKPFASKPTVSLKGIDPTVIDCAKVLEIQKMLQGEIAFVRSEQVRLGDASIVSTQLTRQEVETLTSGIFKRSGRDKCVNPSIGNIPGGFDAVGVGSANISLFPE